MKIKFKIEGLDCANCANELENAISKVEGIQSVSINFLTQKMNIELDENNKDEILSKMNKVIKKEEPDVKIKEV